MMQACEHVRAVRCGGAGRITLERPEKINALTLSMVREITAVLEEWQRDPDLHLVLIDGAGPRGFCAGGDVRLVHDSARAGDDAARTFWAEEYRLNAKIAGFNKPIVAFMSGIVMGGGIGLCAHARHRIVTESARLAMPEVGIGLIPDIGATWLLSRTPGESGTYLALTGEAIGAADAIGLGLAEYFVPQADLEALAAAFLRDGSRGDEQIEVLARRFAASPGEPPLEERRTLIDRSFAYGTVEEILSALLREGCAFALAAAQRLAAKSPTSLKLTLCALRQARGLACLQDCLRLEYRLMSRILHGHDLREGIRAAVIDKDRRPKWLPAELSEISPADELSL